MGLYTQRKFVRRVIILLCRKQTKLIDNSPLSWKGALTWKLFDQFGFKFSSHRAILWKGSLGNAFSGKIDSDPGFRFQFFSHFGNHMQYLRSPTSTSFKDKKWFSYSVESFPSDLCIFMARNEIRITPFTWTTQSHSEIENVERVCEKETLSQ